MLEVINPACAESGLQLREQLRYHTGFPFNPPLGENPYRHKTIDYLAKRGKIHQKEPLLLKEEF